MDDIDRHPQKRFRDHGSSYQISASPKFPAEAALDVGSDVAHQRKGHVDSSLQLEIEEGESVERPTRGRSPCCNIM